ncbi:MAG: hypothetical protein KAW46_10555 [candidate division Zixibacteria bacterium]|nr:hypothetical protein [candidate division Zixibacteria bacterium]
MRDVNVLQKDIVDQATDNKSSASAEVQPDPNEGPKTFEAGRLGGLKGGKPRAKKLTAEQRREIGRKAALAR